MSHGKFQILIDCNGPAKDSLEPLLKSLEALGHMGSSRSILIENGESALDEVGHSSHHHFDGDGPDRITKITVKDLGGDLKESRMDIKASLIRLGKTNPELRPHLREVLASLEKEASRDSVASYHAKFVSEVQGELDTIMRNSAVDSTKVRLQSDLSVVSGIGTLIYQYGRQMADELRFAVTSSPNVVARRLASRLEEDLRTASSDKPLTRREEKDLARANVFIMDVEMDGGGLPPRIEALSHLPRRFTPSEAREILDYFYKTAPGSY